MRPVTFMPFATLSQTIIVHYYTRETDTEKQANILTWGVWNICLLRLVDLNNQLNIVLHFIMIHDGK